MNQFDPPEEPFVFDPNEPMKTAAEMLNRFPKMLQPTNTVPSWPQQPAGFDYRNSCTISAHGFVGAARIVERFDELAKQIEAEQP
jgi:hypothetical protein